MVRQNLETDLITPKPDLPLRECLASPEYIKNDDALNGRQLDLLAVHLQPHRLVQVLAHLAAHHLAETHLHVHALVAQSGIHRYWSKGCKLVNERRGANLVYFRVER